MKILLKDTLDSFLSHMKFDRELHERIYVYNLELMTSSDANRRLFSTRDIGVDRVMFGLADKENFFNEILYVTSRDFEQAITKVNSFNRSFKISNDSINLACFYIAHKFLENKSIKEADRIEYAKEILDTFSIRTLLTLTSNYFVYPISEEESLSLIERLSYKYIIKQVNNWKEYCEYRSDEYIKSKYKNFLIKFHPEDELPAAINDLFSRTKSTLKNIYSELMEMKKNEDVVSTLKNTVIDASGKDVIIDRTETADTYYEYLKSTLADKNSFYKREIVYTVRELIKNTYVEDLEQFLSVMYDYMTKNDKNYKKITELFRDTIVFFLSYLTEHKSEVNLNSSIVQILDKLLGILLYSRSTDKTLNDLKEEYDKLVMTVFKEEAKRVYPVRRLPDLRNSVIAYLLIRTFMKKSHG